MAGYSVEETNNRFVVNRPDGSWLCLDWDEMQAIVNFMRKRRWTARIEDQIEKDEYSLDLDTDIDRQMFVNLCIADIEDKAMMYAEWGEDYEPDYESVVFDVAQVNDIWRD